MNSHYEKFLATGEVKCIDDEIPFEIPEGWEWCRISSAFQLNPKNKCDDSLDAAFIPMEKIEATYGSSFSYAKAKWKDIKNGFTHFADGDVAFAKITPCFQNRKSAIFNNLPNGIGAGTTELKVLRPLGDTICRWYLLFFLKSPYFIEEATFKGTANQQRILSGYLENKLFPVPPKEEQERIVEKLNVLLNLSNAYEKSYDALEALNANIHERLKKSILQEAIQGKLVPQDPTDEPASVLLERIREEKLKLVKEGKLKKKDITDSIIFKGEDNKYFEKIGKEVTCIDEEIPFEIPDNWCWVRHNSLFEISGGSQPPKSHFIYTPRKGYIRLFQIRDYGENPQPVYIPICDASKTTQKGDIILARYGASLGKVFYAEDGAYNVAMAKVIPLYESELIYKDFIYLFYRSNVYQMLIKGHSRSAQAGFNKEDLNDLFFPLPPLAEQHRIVSKIEELYKSLK